MGRLAGARVLGHIIEVLIRQAWRIKSESVAEVFPTPWLETRWEH
jgi:hypothetical protein